MTDTNENLALRLLLSQALLALKALHYEVDLGCNKADPQVISALAHGESAMQNIEAMK